MQPARRGGASPTPPGPLCCGAELSVVVASVGGSARAAGAALPLSGRMEKGKVRKVVPAKDGRKVPWKTECDGKESNSVKRKIYMDYNATTPLALEVIQTVTEAMQEAWGNPSSTYKAGRKAKETISRARESLARMVGGQPEDIIFTSGGTEANNLIIHTALRCFRESWVLEENGPGEKHSKPQGVAPHFVTSSVEHDSVRLPLEHLVRENVAAHPRALSTDSDLESEENDIRDSQDPGAHRCSTDDREGTSGCGGSWCGLPHYCGTQGIPAFLLDVFLPGTLELTLHLNSLSFFYAPRIGALYVRGPGVTTPLHPMLFGGGQERNFRPGTENTPMIAGLGKAAELVNKSCEVYEAHMQEVRDYLEARLETVFGKRKIHFNSRFSGSRRLCNTCNFSILGSGLQGHKVLSCCKTLLASVGAACHSEKGDDQPSSILLSCGIPYDVAQNALRLSVGRDTTQHDVDLVVDDLKEAVAQLEQSSTPLT